MKTKTMWCAAAICLSMGLGMGASARVEAGVGGTQNYAGPLCLKLCDYAREDCLANGGSELECEDQWFSCIVQC